MAIRALGYLGVFLVLLGLVRPAQAQQPDSEIVIGALLGLSGGFSRPEESPAWTALQLARDDVNTFLTASGSERRVRLIVEDTALEPERARPALARLANRGVRTVVGPQSSTELAAIRDDAAARGIVLLSGDSTAPSLAIPGDNVLRFVPDDRQQAEAIATLMWARGIRVLVTIARGDIYGDELAAATAAAFAARGGTVVQQITYDPEAPDVTRVIGEAATGVATTRATHAASEIGVYLVSFDEAIPLLAAGGADPSLRGTRWFGSDGLAQNAALLRDPAAAAFAEAAGLACPTIGLSDPAKEVWQPLQERARARYGVELEALSFASYDAFWVGSLAALAIGPTSDAAALRRAIHRTADSYFGATGWTRLNAAGDRAGGDYDFGAVSQAEDMPVWERIATYRSVGGRGTLERRNASR